MSWRTVIISSTAKLDYQMGYLVLRKDDVTKIHLSEIETVMIESTSVSLTAALLCELTKKKIKVIFCDEKRNPSSELISYYGAHDTSLKVRNQIAWTDDIKKHVWTEIVAEKIRKQALHLQHWKREEADLLYQYINEIEFGDATNREGHAAKVYFNALFGMDFTRSAENVTNAALNYGYSLLLSTFNRCVVANGYITQLGLFHPVYQNTDIVYYDEAVKGLEAQLSALSKAEKFIFMEYHAIEDAEAWKKIQKVLEERVQAGVEVRVFYDDMGSIGFINTDFVKKMERIGIHCRVFNPFMPGLNVFLNNRDHRKITVIDGKVAFTGGYNLANEYFNYTNPYGQWKDTGIRLEGDAVQSLTATFLEMWNAANDRNNNEDFSKYFIRSEYKAAQNGFVQPYADSPMDDEQVGEEVYISMVNKAEKYCWFITPYLIITDEMTHALCLAAKRGIDVRIITPGIPDKKMIYSVTRSFYHGLVKNGVRIYEWTPGFCHAKMSVADDCMATCGTINLDYRSLYHHFENGCFMADSPAVLSIRNDLEETMKECREVTEQYRTGRSAYLRLGQLFMRLFAGLL